VWSVGINSAKAHDVYLGTRAVAVCAGAERLFSEEVNDYETALATAGRLAGRAAKTAKDFVSGFTAQARYGRVHECDTNHR